MANTPNLDLEEPVHGSSDWDTPLNSNFSKIDAGVVVLVPQNDQTVAGAFALKLPNGQLSVSGEGLGSAFDSPSLVDINSTSSTPYGLTIRTSVAASGEGLSFYIDTNGDAFIANTASDGTTLNSIILRGAADGSYVRFGPNSGNGVSVGLDSGPGTSPITFDGVIEINVISGAGINLASIGGGTVTLKPESFATATPTQLLPNASGTVAVVTTVPSTAGSTGVTGQIAADASFFYICTATNTWKRVAIVAW